MDTLDKLVILALVLGGGFIAGLNGNNAFGVIVGGLAGLGLVAVIFGVGDIVDSALRKHYNDKGRF
jgi:hypothetical protein